MVSGFNSNVSVRGRTYHIQSEDVRGEDPHILTLAYREGAIMGRIKTSYRDLLGPSPSPQDVRALMIRQHRQMIEDIHAGKFETEARG